MERYHHLAPLATDWFTTITFRGWCRCIPFNRQPLWSSAAVSSHQDVLEASHCASLTANLRQLADVVLHGSQMFDRLNGQVRKQSMMALFHFMFFKQVALLQSVRATERCQRAELRLSAVQQMLKPIASGKFRCLTCIQESDSSYEMISCCRQYCG